MINKIYTSFFLLFGFSLSASAQITEHFKPGPATGQDAIVMDFPGPGGGCIPRNNTLTPAAQNYGNMARIGTESWTFNAQGCSTGNYRSYIKFTGLNSIPAGATINSATLILQTTDSAMDQANSQYPTAPASFRLNPGWLKRVLPGAANSWDESMITWNSALTIQTDPTTLNWVELPTTTCHENCTLQLDVTDVVQAIFDDAVAQSIPVAAANNGFFLQLQTEIYYQAQNWAASEYPDSAYRPELIVTFVACDSLGLSAQPNPACEGDDIQLNSINLPNTNYHWTGPGGFTSSVYNPVLPNARVANAGNFILTIDNAYCQSSDTLYVAVNPSPPTTPIADPNPACVGDDIHLTTNDISGITFEWEGPAGFSSTSAGTIVPDVTAQNSGLYTLTATDPTTGCSVTDSLNIVIDNGAVISGLSADPNPVCVGDDVQLKVNDLGNVSYQWVGPLGFSSHQRNPVLSQAGLDKKGWYKLHVVDWISSCTTTDSIDIKINPYPKVSLGHDTIICEGDIIELKPSKDYFGAQFNWSTGAGTHTLSVGETGVYSLTITYPPSCFGSDSIEVQALNCNCVTGIPTAFTPNGDGLNDVFNPAEQITCPVRDYFLQIYNRYGQKVFLSHSTDVGWNGRYNNQEADLGTYVYYLSYKEYFSGEERQVKGSLTLIR